jgi:hypothetical protein
MTIVSKKYEFSKTERGLSEKKAMDLTVKT